MIFLENIDTKPVAATAGLPDIAKEVGSDCIAATVTSGNSVAKDEIVLPIPANIPWFLNVLTTLANDLSSDLWFDTKPLFMSEANRVAASFRDL